MEKLIKGAPYVILIIVSLVLMNMIGNAYRERLKAEIKSELENKPIISPAGEDFDRPFKKDRQFVPMLNDGIVSVMFDVKENKIFIWQKKEHWEILFFFPPDKWPDYIPTMQLLMPKTPIDSDYKKHLPPYAD
jgi:hypothetical protein